MLVRSLFDVKNSENFTLPFGFNEDAAVKILKDNSNELETLKSFFGQVSRGEKDFKSSALGVKLMGQFGVTEEQREDAEFVEEFTAMLHHMSTFACHLERTVREIEECDQAIAQAGAVSFRTPESVEHHK